MRKWMLALLLCLPGCIQTKLNNTERLMNRSDFPDAVQGAPEWTRAALRVVSELEERIESQP